MEIKGTTMGETRDKDVEDEEDAMDNKGRRRGGDR